MIVNRERVTSLVKGLNKILLDVMAATGRQLKPEHLAEVDFIMKVSSSSSSEEHPWINAIPGFREWVGERLVRSMDINLMTIVNKKYEATRELSVDDIEDDKIGAASVLMQGMAADAVMLPRDLGITALTTNDTWADGSAFYLANRTYGASTIKNLLSGSSAGVLTATNFDTAVALMQNYAYDGIPLYVQPELLVVAPGLRTTAWNIVSSSKAVVSNAAVDNPNKDLVALKVDPSLAAGHWYLTASYRNIKPVCYQERIAPQFQTNYSESSDWNSDMKFMKDKIMYGARARGRAFKTAPHLILKGDGT